MMRRRTKQAAQHLVTAQKANVQSAELQYGLAFLSCM